MEIRPDSVYSLLEAADDGQHRESRLHQHPVLPLAALTQFAVGRIALRGLEGAQRVPPSGDDTGTRYGAAA